MFKSSVVGRAPGVAEKGNTQSMDCLESLEIYIPVEAEVKTISLWSLPNSVLRRMGLPLYDTKGSRKLAESPEGVWISPAVLRKKGQRPPSSADNSMTENMSSLMGKVLQGGTGPFRMSFVTSNHAAYTILQDVMPKGQVSAHTSRSSQLHRGSAPQTYQDAIVIYHGRIYLSIRKPSRSQQKQETHGPKPAYQFSVLPTADVSPKSQTKRQSSEASLDPADKHLKRTRMNVTVPKISSSQPDHPTTYKELQKVNGPKKRHTTCKVTQSENTMDVTHQGRSTVHNMQSHCHEAARGEQTAEKATCREAAWVQLRGKQEAVVSKDTEIQNSVSEETDGTSQNNDSGECDNIVGVAEHSSNQSWCKRASQRTACTSTSLQQEYDELAQEEEISQMKAKLRLSEAVLNNMYSSF